MPWTKRRHTTRLSIEYLGKALRYFEIPLLNEDKAKYSCGVTHPACPNTENITPLEPPVVKFSMALPEHSFHAKEPNSSDKSAPIPFLNTEKAKYACGVRSGPATTLELHTGWKFINQLISIGYDTMFQSPKGQGRLSCGKRINP